MASSADWQDPDYEEFQRSGALPMQAEDRASDNIKSPDFQLPKEDDTPQQSVQSAQESAANTPKEEETQPATQSAPVQNEAAEPAMEPLESHVAAPQEEPPGESSALSQADSVAQSNPGRDVNQALEDFRESAVTPAPGYEASYAADRANRQAGVLRYAKAQGVQTEVLPDGTETVKTDESGAPVFNPGPTGYPAQNKDGRWVQPWRDAQGNVNEQDLIESGNYSTNARTGDRYFRDPMTGQPVVIGKDPVIEGRNQLLQQRADLMLDQRNENLQAQQTQFELGKVKQGLKAFKANPEVVGYATAMDTMAINPDAYNTPEGQKSVQDAKARYDAYVKAHPEVGDLFKQQDDLHSQLDGLKQSRMDRAGKVNAILGDLNLIKETGMLPQDFDHTQIVGANGNTVPIQNGDADPRSAETAAAAASARGQSPTAAMRDTLEQAKARGAQTVGGQTIDDALSALPPKPEPTPQSVRQDYLSGRISKEDAVSQLRQLSANVGKFGAAANAREDAAIEAGNTAKKTSMAENMFREGISAVSQTVLSQVAGIGRIAGADNFADVASQGAKMARDYYGADQARTEDTSSKIARGIGAGLTLLAETYLAGTAAPAGAGALVKTATATGGALPMAAGAYEDAFDKSMSEQQRAEGVADKAAAYAKARIAAIRTAPEMAAFIIANRLTAGAVAPLLKGVAPVTKALITSAAATIANEASSTAIAGVNALTGQGKASDIAPSWERFATSLVFGLHGGIEATVGHEKALSTSRDILSGNSEAINALSKKADDPATPASDRSQALNTVRAMRIGAVRLLAQNGEAPKGVSERYQQIYQDAQNANAELSTAQSSNDMASVATAKEKAQRLAGDLHAASRELVYSVPDRTRGILGRLVSKDTNVPSDEKAFDASPFDNFAHAEIGRTVRDTYLTPEQEGKISKVADAQLPPEQKAAADIVVDQHVGREAMRDVEKIAKGQPVDEARAQRLEELGLVQRDANGRRVATDDGKPLFSRGLSQAIDKVPDKFAYTQTPDNPGNLLHNLVAGGVERFSQIAGKSDQERVARAPEKSTGETSRPTGAEGVHNVSVESEPASGNGVRTKTVLPVRAANEQEAVSVARRQAEEAGHTVHEARIATPEEMTASKLSQEIDRAKRTAKTVWDRYRPDFEKLGVKQVKRSNDIHGPMALSKDGTLLMNPEQLAKLMRSRMQQEGITAEQAVEKIMVHEQLHAVAVKALERSGIKAEELFTTAGKEITAAARRLYGKDVWDKQTDWQRGHEILRMVLERKYSGKLTEQIMRAVRHVAEYLGVHLDRLPENALLRKAAAEVELTAKQYGIELGGKDEGRRMKDEEETPAVERLQRESGEKNPRQTQVDEINRQADDLQRRIVSAMSDEQLRKTVREINPKTMDEGEMRKLDAAREELARREGEKVEGRRMKDENARGKESTFDDDEDVLSAPRAEQESALNAPKVDDRGIISIAEPRPSRYKSPDDHVSDPAAILGNVTQRTGGSGADSRQRWKPGRQIASHAEVVDWAKRNGRDEIAPQVFDQHAAGGGGEHLVFVEPGATRLTKVTKPGLYGAQAGDAGAYLQRLALQNHIFGDDVKFEGFVQFPGEDDSRAVISQPFVAGRDSTPEELADYMRAKGFRETDPGSWVHPVMGVAVWDGITPGNAITDAEGNVHPIDLQLAPAEAVTLKKAQGDAGVGGETLFSPQVKEQEPAIESREEKPAPDYTRRPDELEPAKSVNELVKENVGLAVTIANDYRNIPNHDFDNTVGEAKRALVHAARNYDSTRPEPFSAYASAAIRNRLNDLFRKSAGIAAHEGTSLDAATNEHGNNSFHETVADGGVRNAGADMEREETHRALREAISNLSEKPRRVLEGRLQGMSGSDIADQIGVSKQMVSRIEASARESVKRRLAERGLRNLDTDNVLFAPRVDEDAHEAATSPLNGKPEPTEAQKEAGNYEKGHLDLNGLDISIENPAGSKRRPEWPALESHYGYLKGTVGRDGDHVDVFIKPGTPKDWDGPVFVVNQKKPGNGHFDETKAVIGVHSAVEAREEYLKNYEPGWEKNIHSIAEMPFEDFKRWTKEGDMSKPAEETEPLGAPTVTLKPAPKDTGDPYELFPPPESDTAVQKTKEVGKSAIDDLLKVFAPQNRSEAAKGMGNILQEQASMRARQNELVIRAARNFYDYADRLSREDKRNLRDAMEGTAAPKDDRMREMADAAKNYDRLRTEQVKAQMKALGIDDWENFKNYNDYVVPHLFARPEAARRVLEGKIEGSKGWLQHREIPTWKDIEEFQKELIAQGMEKEAAALAPAHDNPVEMMFARWHQQEKFLMAQRMFREAEKSGYGHWEDSDYTPVGDEKRIDQRIGTKMKETTYALKDAPAGTQERKTADYLIDMAKRFQDDLNNNRVPADKVEWMKTRLKEVNEQLESPVQEKRKQYFYMPEPAARIVENYLSPGLRQDRPWFQAYLGAANVLNQAQLGFSAFHAGFTAMDTMTSKLALAINQTAKGQFGDAMKSLAEVPFSPILTPLRGDKLIKEWYSPGSQSDEVQKIVQAAISGGWRGSQDSIYATQMTKRMISAFRSGTLKGIAEGTIRAPMALVEQMSRPIMEWLVPRMKAGVMADLLRMEMKKNPAMTMEQLRSVADKAARSVDNRLGQLVYDNLHINKTVKDLGMASVRSLGWNVGTFREIGGGILDLRKLAKGELTYRAAYVLALPVLTAAIGAMMQKMFTGKSPEDMKDLFYPRTGEKDAQGRDQRITLPSYAKDVYAYGHDPSATVSHKLHPLLGMMAELWGNEDFYGVQIRDPQASIPKQALQVAEHVGKAVEPFASRGARQMHNSGESAMMQALPFIGITPAPASIKKTAAENLATEFQSFNTGHKVMTAAQAEHRDARSEALQAFRNHDYATPAKMMSEGKLTPKDYQTLAKTAQQTPLQVMFGHLNPDQALAVYAKATPSERNLLAVQYAKKLAAKAKQDALIQGSAFNRGQ